MANPKAKLKVVLARVILAAFFIAITCLVTISGWIVLRKATNISPWEWLHAIFLVSVFGGVFLIVAIGVNWAANNAREVISDD